MEQAKERLKKIAEKRNGKLNGDGTKCELPDGDRLGIIDSEKEGYVITSM